jgi:demethylmenaquinone methyltransferase/2-methoxy-6-polyprenyl-1,4-benzoquinol methylase
VRGGTFSADLRGARRLIASRRKGEGAIDQQNRLALDLFAPLGPTYDRYARLFSFGQDPRWRRFLVSRIDARPNDTIVDVASGTGAVAIELVRRTGCAVVGVDQSPEMLAVARDRAMRAGLADRIRFVEAGAERLPFADGEFDGLTFTYLLRYVRDVPATLRELARVVRPGGAVGELEFGVPGGAAGPLWSLYVGAGLPVAGRLVSPHWSRVGRFLGPSIRAFAAEWPAERLASAWEEAGIGFVRSRRMSFGGGVVTWGTRR